MIGDEKRVVGERTANFVVKGGEEKGEPGRLKETYGGDKGTD